MPKIGRWIGLAVALSFICTSPPILADGMCSAQSAAHRVSLLELYTSEGCSSCPPADRWLSALPKQGISTDMAVVLAFHVDYWNQLGWPDRFSQPSFTARQDEVARRASRGVIYTSQLVLDGRDLRQGYSVEQLRKRLAAINAEKARARIDAKVQRSAKELQVSGAVEVLDRTASQGVNVWIAAFENGLSSRVNAGENAGKRLDHDYVVRELAGPFPIGPDGRAQLQQTIRLRPDWGVERMGIAVFVERHGDGEILEATAMFPLCPS